MPALRVGDAGTGLQEIEDAIFNNNESKAKIVESKAKIVNALLFGGSLLYVV